MPGVSKSSVDLLQRLRAHLTTHLDKGTPRLRQVAKDLACGERTLQRHLRELDTSFFELLEAVRRERYDALRMAGQLSEEDLAQALGYSDARSFRRWRRGGSTRRHRGSAGPPAFRDESPDS